MKLSARLDRLERRIERLRLGADEHTLYPLPLGDGETVSLSGADLDRLFRELDGKTRGIPSQVMK